MQIRRHPIVRLLVVILCYWLTARSVIAEEKTNIFNTEAHERRLPPTPKWQGKSRKFVRGQDDPWITPAELSGFKLTATYQELTEYLRRLSAHSEHLSVLSIAQLPGGYDLPLVVAATCPEHTADALRSSGKPTVLIQAGIHPGEIAGSAAGLMLLRDLVGGEARTVLEKVNVIFVPVLNVYGHEQHTEHGRSNQRGPANAGWRTNACNLDLNRDFAKLDTPEVRAVVQILNDWDPILFIDSHTTDGMNYQYDVTWNNNGSGGYSPASTRWLDEVLTPAVEAELESLGHIPGPSVVANDPMSPEAGFYPYLTDGPRYSNAYGDARQIPSLLLESHALKPFEQRVLGAYSFFISTLRVVGSRAGELEEARTLDRAARPDQVVLDWEADKPAKQFDFKGFKYEIVHSAVSGGNRVVWTDIPKTYRVDYASKSTPRFTAPRPDAYWIAPQWTSVIERIQSHGIQTETLAHEQPVEVVTYRLKNCEFADGIAEGRLRVTAELIEERQQVLYPRGSVRIATDQPLGTLAVILLEPQGVDSFFQWGFFNAVLSRTESAEDYIMEAVAEDMLEADPMLRETFERQLNSDPDLRSNRKARLDWFYRRTPFYDRQSFVYPVGLER